MLNVDPITTISHTFLGRLFDRVDIIKPVSNVRLSVRMYVRTYFLSIHRKFLQFQ